MASTSTSSAFHEIAPSNPSTSAPSSLPYDVFINHRGSDVKRTLATDIYRTLTEIGLQVFLDNKELQPGDYLPTALEEAMRNALFHIAIFSKNYAQSPWCLAELAFMLKTGTKIIPVFYYVQTDDLRWAIKGKGIYADAFSQHESKNRYTSDQLQRWKEALHKASFYSGHVINNEEDEGRLLKTIVNSVLGGVKNVPLEVAKHPVGLDEAVEDFEKTTLQSAQGHQNVQIVGIWGMGGSGKTTLAKDFYNRRYSSFEKRSCFLFDVRDAHAKGLLHSKQMSLLHDLGVKSEEFDNIEQGKAILARRLRSVRVFIVVDDVDHSDQLDALLPPEDILGDGSLIIVTTRKKDVLTRPGISSIYKLRALDADHANQLFCWHAFLRPYPLEGFEKLVENFVKVCAGLPLSLKVIGAQLYGKTEQDYWNSLLEKIARILPSDVINRLRVSYDALDKEEKEAFLDAACFFIGEERSLAIEVWNGSEGSGLCSWDSLVNKCLLEVDEMDCIKMHDHLRDLGRAISYEQLPYRLWLPQEQTINVEKQEEKRISIRGIMATSTRLRWDYNEKNEGIYRFRRLVEADGSSREDRKVLFNTREGSWSLSPSLGGLKYIVVRGHNLNEVIGEASRELVWLRWLQVGQRNLPSRLSLKNLRILELYEEEYGSDHQLEELWDDAGEAPIQLRELVISGCTGFQRLPESIGSLQHLKKLVIQGFLFRVKLKSLPRDFCLLQSLEHLKLCCPLSSLPDNFGDLRNLRYLYLSERGGLKRLPISFKKLTLLQHLILKLPEVTLESDIMEDMTKLEQLNLSSWKVEELPHHITNQPSLTELHLQTEFLREVPVNIGQLSKLQKVEIGSSLLTSLPDSLGNLSSLTSLDLSCEKLESLPDSLGKLSSLTSLDLVCETLKTLPDSLGNLSSLTSLDLFCEMLKSLPDSLGNLSFLTSLLCRNNKLESLPDSLGNLSSLTSLHLSCQKLESLPDSLGNLSSLTNLQIYGSDIPGSVGRLSLSQNLRIRYSGVKSLPKSVRDLTNLQDLYIVDCPISELDLGSGPFASSLCNLKRIHLRSTGVSKISISEDCCPGLQTLQLFSNDHLTEIEVLPTTVKDIELGNCKILRNIRGIVGLVNIRKLSITGCPELDELPSVAQFASAQEFEVNGCYRAKKIQGLEDSTALEELTAERLRKVQLIAISRSAIQPYIQTMKKWPEEEMRVCVRAVPTAASLLNSFAFENLSIVASLDNQIIDKKLAQKWSHNGDAIIVCFVINCVPLTMSLSSKYIDFMSEAELEEGKWVWIAIFTQGFKWWRETGGKIEVEKAVVGVGEHRRVWEAFCGLWRDLPE